MKIIHMISGGDVGGAKTHVLSLLAGLNKTENVHLVCFTEGDFAVDLTGKKSGRGAYRCPKAECLEQARKGHRLERSFECAIDAAVYDALADELQKELTQKPEGANA